MSVTYYICPYCRVVTLNSYMGREYRYCTQCGHTFDIDDTDAVTVGERRPGQHERSEAARKAVTVGQSQPEGHNMVVASHSSPSPSAVGPSTARSGGTS